MKVEQITAAHAGWAASVPPSSICVIGPAWLSSIVGRCSHVHYWNKGNFEGLLELASDLEKTPELRPLAQYCSLREKGLRPEALARLDDFLDKATQWDADLARRNVSIVLQAHARTPEAHQFLTQPLLTRWIYPTLEKWASDEPSAADPLRWLGLLRSNPDALRRALTSDPSDVPVRRRLINLALGDADYATHHLSESILLSTVEETRAAIITARRWIESAPDRSPFADLSADADEYEQMVEDWVAYSQSPEGTFPEWCVARGRTYRWPTIVYYDEQSAQPDAAAKPHTAAAVHDAGEAINPKPQREAPADGGGR